VTQTLDPIFQQTTTFTHSERPQSNTVQSRSPVLISDSRVFNNSIQQGLLSGGSISLGFRTNYLDENSPSNILNPSTAANLPLSFQHNLLRGFGRKVNERNITVSKLNVETSDVAFRSQVIAVVNQVVNTYITLAASQEDLKAKQLALEVAETLMKNARRQVEIGVLAPPELTRFEAQAAQSRLALVTSETAVAQQELRLKNLLSRDGVADPALAAAHVILTGRLSIPATDDLPPIEEMVKKARANRTDLIISQTNLKAAEISAAGTANGVLPSLQAFGVMTSAGLAGTARPGQTDPDPFFVGGFPAAAGQVFRRNFPTDRAGAFISVPIRNRQAQSDFAIDQLQYRQSQLTNLKALNQVEVVS
jgi:outer membrane protein TolC